MLDSIALDVVIGLAFVYLIFSIFCAAINEWIARWAELRAKTLKEGIDELLNDPAACTLATAFHNHPLVTALALDKKRSGYPSYIPARIFAQALYDVAFTQPPGDAAPGNQLTQVSLNQTVTGRPARALAAVLKGAESDVRVIQSRLAAWFDDSMERVSGLYKRRAQLIIVGIATFLTLALNIDTVRIARALHSDPVLRAALVASADAARRDSLGAVAWRPQVDSLSAALPVGWRPCGGDRWAWECADWFIPTWLLGVLLTIVALSLGAPFWFDTLNKLANLRQTGVPPDERKSRETPAVVP